MPCPGNHHQFVRLACAHERGAHLHGAGRVHVVVELADHEHELSRELRRVDHVRAPLVALVHRPSHPELVPPDLVHAVVVAAAVGHAHGVDLREIKQRAHRVLPTGAAAVDADAREIHPWARGRRGAQPCHVVRKAGVLQVLPADVVELLAAPVGAHAVHLHHHEAVVGHGALAVAYREGLGNEEVLRPGVDLLHHGARRRVGRAARRPPDDAPDVGGAVAALGCEALGHGPSRGEELRRIGASELRNQRAVRSAMQLVHGRQVHARPRVHVPLAPGAPRQFVRAVALRQAHRLAAVDGHAHEMRVVRVLRRVHAHHAQCQRARRLVDVLDGAHHPRPARDLAHDGAVRHVHQVQVVEAVALAHPEQLVLAQPVAPRLVRVIDERG